MDDKQLDAMLDAAVEAVRRAGEIQKRHFGGELKVLAKPAGDIKLEADRLCEKAMVDAIRDRFPSHAVLAEEGGGSGGAEHIWYVDPLDGTVNYYFGVPYFCATVACYRQTPGETAGGLGEPVLGVTYSVLRDDMYVAVAGRGAAVNGRRIRVREDSSLEDAMVLISFGNASGKLAASREATLALSSRVRKIRSFGAAALDLAQVADGTVSAFVEYGLHPWDMAAGAALVEEAGGLVSIGRFGDRLAVVASGRTIHGELLAALPAELAEFFKASGPTAARLP